MSDEDSGKHPWEVGHLRLAVEAAGVAMWSWSVDTDAITMDGRGFELWGVTCCAEATFEEPNGTLDISTTSDDGRVDLMWLEHGGPPVEAPESKVGFGSTLVKRALASQLGGTIDYDWREEGVVATLSLRRERLVA